MKKVCMVFLACFSLCVSQVSLAQSLTNELGTCLIDALNGKERKQLAKWVFLGMAAHPEIAAFSNASDSDIDTTDQYVGGLVTRLLTEDCPAEMNAANKESPLALQQAFELVGQVAMQELMTNENVMASMIGYAKYADMEKIGSLLLEE